MQALLNLFGRSPFAPLEAHMDKIALCVHKLKDIFKAVLEEDREKIDQLEKEISKLEHEADIMKNDIRNHLPKSLFLPIEHSQLLEILTLQDSIADTAEDVAVTLTLKPLVMLDDFKKEYLEFLEKNIEAFDKAHDIIRQMHELLESSFGGTEAEKVRKLVHEVALKEHEVDLIQRELLKRILNAEDKMSYATFHVWQRTIQAVSAISNISEKLANRVRRTLEIKR